MFSSLPDGEYPAGGGEEHPGQPAHGRREGGPEGPGGGAGQGGGGEERLRRPVPQVDAEVRDSRHTHQELLVALKYLTFIYLIFIAYQTFKLQMKMNLIHLPLPLYLLVHIMPLNPM